MRELLLEYIYEDAPVLINRTYKRGKNKTLYKSNEAKQQQDIIAKELGVVRFHYTYDFLAVQINWHSNFFFKNGKFRTKDLDGILKGIIDNVFDGLGIDDKCITSLTANKVQSNQEKVVFQIYRTELAKSN